MKRVLFLIITAIFAISSNAFSQLKEEMRAVKLTNVDSQILFTDEGIEQAIDYLASIGMNAVLPVTFNSAKSQFPSKTMLAYLDVLIDPRMKDRDPFNRVLIEAHRQGMEVYPWFEYGFAAWYSGGAEATGGPFGEKYPHWLSVDVNGDITKKNGFDWLNGLHPEVQEFMNKLVLEMVDTYDLDGIEFSDRIPALPVEGGHDSTTVQLYRKEMRKNPPHDFRDSAWKRWRANKLSDFYEFLKDSVKKRDPHLVVATSPSLYPWGYEEYLQDNVEWVNHNIVDHYIPQLYRTNLADYQFELNKTIQQTIAPKQSMIFAGILMNVGSYTIPIDTLRKMMTFNRAKGLLGEAFFFYEGFLKNDKAIGNFLKSEFYAEPATVPLRNREIRRPKASIAKGKNAHFYGDWAYSNKNTDYEKDSVFVASHSLNAVSLVHNVEVPIPAWYDVYYYNQSTDNTSFADSVQLTIKMKSQADSSFMVPLQSQKYGWQKWASILFSDSKSTIELASTKDGKSIFSPSIMYLINRKKSPNATLLNTSIPEQKHETPDEIQLSNYPNPFNPSTTIHFELTETTSVTLEIYTIQGQLVSSLLLNQLFSSGIHNINFNATNLASGLYLYRLKSSSQTITKKMTLIK